MLDLRPWPGLRPGRALSGCHRNAVHEVSGGPVRLVARRSRRGAASLAWELDLLDHLARHGFSVPAVVPAGDGRRSVDGVVVQTWLDGHRPEGREWDPVVAELVRLHRITRGWPRRPGAASTRDLLVRDRAGDVDLTRMPPDAVADCRAAWRALAGVPTAVVHGDPDPSNVRVDGRRVGLLDWDEARVDRVDLDLADIPTAPLPGGRGRRAAAAADAWEAAAGWGIEPAYARARLARLRARR